MEYEPNATQWFEPKELKIHKGQKEAFFNPQDRPITPPRPTGNLKW